MFDLSLKLLHWYDQNHRTFPWRAPLGESQDPYRVWLSEIMLQQTTTTAVQPYFRAFLEKWPTLQSFAQANMDEVLQAWQGLGYYTRARNLIKCAQIVVSEYGGHFPCDLELLKKLPGIGPYTAAAIYTIAFDKPATAVDGNVIRVFSRLKALPYPMPKHKKEVETCAAVYVPLKRPGDYTQALMDLGATICTSKNPLCSLCPWQHDCMAFQKGEVLRFPVREEKRERPEKFTVAFVIENEKGEILFRKRPEKGLLAHMYELPNLPWESQEYEWEDAIKAAPLHTQWISCETVVKHTFTHLDLYVKTLKTRVKKEFIQGVWCHPRAFETLALPTLFKKVLRSSMF